MHISMLTDTGEKEAKRRCTSRVFIGVFGFCFNRRETKRARHRCTSRVLAGIKNAAKPYSTMAPTSMHLTMMVCVHECTYVYTYVYV